MFNIYQNYKWNYDEALIWIKEKERECLQQDKKRFLALCSHYPPTITFGKNILIDDILNFKILNENKVIFRGTNRGGGVTLHNLGQLVAYPVISLLRLKLNIKDFIFILEECMIKFFTYWNIKSVRRNKNPGIYVNDKKIGFIGLRISKNIITHGICLNINNNISLYSHFIPCKQKNLLITSLSVLLKKNIEINIASRIFKKIFIEYFSKC